jgi:ABC-type lipopolysaccharide export system ATPase subunit
MLDKPVENVDIVAAILTSAIVQNIEIKITNAGGMLTDEVVNKALEIFNKFKLRLEK